MLASFLPAALLSVSALATPLSLSPRAATSTVAVHNNFTCRSTIHPNPVVLLHGLGATYYEDINELELFLQGKGYCTFSLTYGASAPAPYQYVGGLQAINASAPTIANFIKEVQSKTGAAKIDLVGHSEGAFMTLYVPKFEGVAAIVGKVFAIAPPTHGTNFANLYTIAVLGGSLTTTAATTLLNTFGCPACADLVDGGAAIKRLNEGQPIAQPGVNYTVLISKYDELVTPPTTAFIQEAGVKNLYVQDFCVQDPVGHIGEAYDTNVWVLVDQALSESAIKGPATCTFGSPGR